jgi:hypothetical protein
MSGLLAGTAMRGWTQIANWISPQHTEPPRHPNVTLLECVFRQFVSPDSVRSESIY